MIPVKEKPKNIGIFFTSETRRDSSKTGIGQYVNFKNFPKLTMVITDDEFYWKWVVELVILHFRFLKKPRHGSSTRAIYLLVPLKWCNKITTTIPAKESKPSNAMFPNKTV